MRFLDLLKHLDGYKDIVVWDEDWEEEPLFEGCVTDVPWAYADWELATDNDGEALSCVEKDGKTYFVVYIKEV